MATNRDGTPPGQPEPSMEEILASIRRLITEEGQADGQPEHRPTGAAGHGGASPATVAAPEQAEAEAEDVLLLTEVVDTPAERATEEVQAAAAIRPGARTVDDLMAELLRPMLRQWLDANLPAMVERIVREEVARRAPGG